MAVYLWNLFSIPFYSICLNYTFFQEKKRKIILCWLVGIQLFLTAALRSFSVGGDLENYIPAFKNIGSLPWVEIFTYPWEYGYILLNKIIYSCSTDERWLLISVSFFVVTGYMCYIYRYSKICWLSLFLFVALGYYCTSLSMLRQSLAIVCVLNSIRYVIDGNWKKNICWIILGMSFHITSVIFFLLYFLAHFRVTWMYFISFLAGSFLFFMFAGNFVLFYLVENYFSIYEGNMVEGEGYGMLILLLLITTTGVWIKTRLNINDTKMNVFTHMMVLACGLQLCSLQFSLFARVVLYFQLAIIIYIPMLLSYLKGREIKVVGELLVACFVIYYFISIYLENDFSRILPYSFLWEK